MIPAILIVGFERPENVSLILSSIKEYQNNVYLFVDLAKFQGSKKNIAMIALAKEYANVEGVSVFLANKNYGVGTAVPAALDWTFKYEESVIVLEDDCVPNQFTIPYLSHMLIRSQNSHSILMVSGSNPLNENSKIVESAVSSFPLIWGWAIWKDNWLRIAPYVRHEVRLSTILLKVILKPQKAIAISFFTAAYLRSRSGITKAWDGNLALGMLLENCNSIIPNENTITNIGNDSVASHTMYKSDKKEIIVASSKKPSEALSLSKKIIDSAISKEIYNLRTRHLLSPSKATVEILWCKVRNVFGVNR